LGFQAAQRLVAETGSFLAHRAEEADALKEKIDAGTATTEERADYEEALK